MVVPVELATRLVAQHRLALARMFGELGVAFDMTLAQWHPTLPDPMQIPGGTLRSDVRTHMLAMNGIDSRSMKSPAGPLAPPGASCGPDSTLRMSTGPNSSVRFGDSGLAWAGCDTSARQRAEEIGALPAGPMPKSKPGRQMTLDDGEPEDQRVFGPAGIGDDFELVVYWWESPGRLSVGVRSWRKAGRRFRHLRGTGPGLGWVARSDPAAERRRAPAGDGCRRRGRGRRLRKFLPGKGSQTGDGQA